MGDYTEDQIVKGVERAYDDFKTARKYEEAGNLRMDNIYYDKVDRTLREVETWLEDNPDNGVMSRLSDEQRTFVERHIGGY